MYLHDRDNRSCERICYTDKTSALKKKRSVYENENNRYRGVGFDVIGRKSANECGSGSGHNGQTFYAKFCRPHILPRGSWHPAVRPCVELASVRLPGEEHETLQIFGLIESCPHKSGLR